MSQRIVYVVDADKCARMSIFYAMMGAGYQVRSLSNGREFIDELAGLAPGCVLLDLHMPDIDGMQVLELLGDRIGAFPVILMTGEGDLGTAVKAMKLGASDVLEKPVETRELLAAVDRAFESLDQRAASSDGKLAARRLVDNLTRREREVLDGLVDGLPNKVIAYRLGLSIRTVEMHRSSMMQRLRVRSLPEALHISFIAGGGSPPSAPRARAAPFMKTPREPVGRGGQHSLL